MPGCSASCVTSIPAWVQARLADLALAQKKTGRAPRMPFERKGRDHYFCPELKRNGVPCAHLPWSSREVTAWLLRRLKYTGRSAELGVWRGISSAALMRRWPDGGQHLLVDPYAVVACPLGQMSDKHCEQGNEQDHARQQAMMDDIYNATRRELTGRSWGRFGRKRAVFVRNFSVPASFAVANHSLDHIYVDARHDLEGVTQDLAAWWPKLCPGGLFAGHDFTHGWPGVVTAVTRFAIAHKDEVACFSVTADSPPSWLLFRIPRQCPPKHGGIVHRPL